MVAEETKEEKIYKWVLEPEIEADDIIDLDIRDNVSLIKKGLKYNLINDDGDKLLKDDFFGYAIDDNNFYYWAEGSKQVYSFNEDYSFTKSEYAGDYVPALTYYNTERKELFTQIFMYNAVDTASAGELETFAEKHGTNLECFAEVTPKNFTDDGYDVYAEFTDDDLGKYGYYNKENLEITIAPTYDKAFNFYEKLSAVKLDGKAGYIDLEGNIAVPFDFEETRSFDNGKAWVKQDGKWGIIELEVRD